VATEDLDPVFDLIAACSRAAVGFVDYTREELAADLRRGDLHRFGWYGEDGTLVVYGWVRREGASNQAEIDIYPRPGLELACATEALAVLEAQGRELVAEAGHAEPWYGMGAYRTDEETRALLAASGYDVRTTFTRMRIDLDGPVDLPATDVVVRRVHDEAELRRAHEMEEQSFVEHYSHVPVDFGFWHSRLTEQGPDFVQVWFGEVEGEPLGLMVTSRQFEPDMNAGYVRTLGVLPEGRGRGVAKALLRDAFARAQRAGRDAVLLHVDVANVTGALRLYESVGMRPVLEIDAWAKGESSG
jgi:ribosomal protein S18 acetylase RimI-like enzyme